MLERINNAIAQTHEKQTSQQAKKEDGQMRYFKKLYSSTEVRISEHYFRVDCTDPQESRAQTFRSPALRPPQGWLVAL